MIVMWALLALGTILAVEGFLRLPVLKQATALQSLLQKISRTIASPHISDHWKERVLPRYAGQLFMLSITLFGLVCLAVSPFLLLGLLAGLAEVDFLGFMSTLPAIGASTALAIVYAIARKRLA